MKHCKKDGKSGCGRNTSDDSHAALGGWAKEKSAQCSWDSTRKPTVALGAAQIPNVNAAVGNVLAKPNRL
ncbi:hypothetical protein M728_005451 (plasmid) [Ensifer sp. WSM1721]